MYRDAERQALWETWLCLEKHIKDESVKYAYDILQQLGQAACELLQSRAACFARLGNADEQVYDVLVRLMGIYRQVVDLGKTINQCGQEAVELVDGICAVLGARLLAFDELSLACGMDDDCNPVAKEKRMIIERAADLIRDYVDAIDLEGHVSNLLVEAFIPQLHTSFMEALQLCLTELDDLHIRKTAGLFTEQLTREWEELGNIIKVQVIALESVASDTVEPGDCPLPTVHSILNVLREAYQQTGPVVDELQRLLTSPPIVADIEIDEFAEAIAGSIQMQPFEPSPAHSNDFITSLSKEAVAIFEQQRQELEKTAYQSQQILSGDKMLAEEVTLLFSKVKEALPQIDALQPSHETEALMQILNGIAETIAIKIDILTDGIAEFDEAGQNMLRTFDESRITVTEEDILSVAENIYATWKQNPPKTVESIEEFLISVMGCGISSNIMARIQKQGLDFADRIDKFSFRFKKETLLYEICTYEEILTHSASRLRDSEWTEMIQAEAELSDTYNSIEALLGQNNIVPIRPAVHEMFNAFEHEVLVAEKAEGFAKGEIIKIINTGYRLGDRVIVRANVIAAR